LLKCSDSSKFSDVPEWVPNQPKHHRQNSLLRKNLNLWALKSRKSNDRHCFKLVITMIGDLWRSYYSLSDFKN
jgi:hypothetical protein